MAEDAAAAAAAAAEKEEPAKKADPSDLKTKKKRKGLLSRVWNVVFRGGGEDYEKRLQYLSKEEAAVHARMKRRTQGWRKSARNIIVCSAFLEVVAVIYAITTTRSIDLSWQMRAVRVFPMFLFPCLSFVIYSTLGSFTRMRDRKDLKTLERLRAERQAKIDELKERTNYYTTQQLIQRYDLDPAAKAAAATVLASKLGADSGLKLFLGEESKLNTATGKSNDVELVPSDGLRNRKQSSARTHTSGSSVAHRTVSEAPPEIGPDGQDVSQGQRVVEHYKGSGTNEGGWIARIAAILVGEDPTQSYALICGNCRMHNGLARKEDFPYITYYCPHCHALNGPRQSEGHDSQNRQSEGHDPGSGSVSGNISPSAPSDSNIARSVSSTSSIVDEVEASGNLATVQEQLVEAD